MKLILVAVGIAILVGCRTRQDIDSLYWKPDRITSTEKAGVTKELYPPEMCKVLKTFHHALADENYELALSLCSKEIQAAGKTYESAKAFMTTMFPLDDLFALKESPMNGAWVYSDWEKKEPDSMLCTLEIEGSYWQWSIDLVDGKWVIDFKLYPFKQWLDENRAYKKRSEAIWKIRNTSLNAKLLGVHTILSSSKTTFKLGDPILLKLELENGASAGLHYHNDSGVRNTLTVKTEAGENLAYIAPPCQTALYYRPIKPRQRVTLFDALDVSKRYRMDKLGVYTIQFSGRGYGLLVGERYKIQQFEKDYSAKRGHDMMVDTRMNCTEQTFPSNTIKITIVK